MGRPHRANPGMHRDRDGVAWPRDSPDLRTLSVRPMGTACDLRSLLHAAWDIPPTGIEAAEVEHEVQDGETLPSAGGLEAVHTPGRSAGQLAFLWPQHGGVLIASWSTQSGSRSER